MVMRHAVHAGQYFDSVRLMAVSSRLEGLPGVTRAAAMMATAANREILAAAGLLSSTAAAPLRASDLVVAVQAGDEAAAMAALEAAEHLLRAEDSAGGASLPASGEAPRTVEAARRLLPEANLALVSVPGPYSHYEAKQALRQGLHVLLFSDNVAVATEVALKELATR